MFDTSIDNGGRMEHFHFKLYDHVLIPKSNIDDRIQFFQHNRACSGIYTTNLEICCGLVPGESFLVEGIEVILKTEDSETISDFFRNSFAAYCFIVQDKEMRTGMLLDFMPLGTIVPHVLRITPIRIFGGYSFSFYLVFKKAYCPKRDLVVGVSLSGIFSRPLY